MAKIRKSSTKKLINSAGMNNSPKPTSLTSQAQTFVRPNAKLNAATDLKKLSSGDLPALKGIQFGSPSNTGTKSSSSGGAGSQWTNLIKTASGGVASLVGGGFLESGIGSIISGLTSLFGGGGKTEMPLTRFALPDSQQQTLYVNSGFQGPVYKQADITQAVKNALLTSSSLNDVIAEI